MKRLIITTLTAATVAGCGAAVVAPPASADRRDVPAAKLKFLTETIRTCFAFQHHEPGHIKIFNCKAVRLDRGADGRPQCFPGFHVSVTVCGASFKLIPTKEGRELYRARPLKCRTAGAYQKHRGKTRQLKFRVSCKRIKDAALSARGLVV